MKFATVVVTRTKACHVKTMHTILKMNIQCMIRGFHNEIIFCNDCPYDKADTVQHVLKKGQAERIFFIDFGIHVDENSIAQLFEKHEGTGVLVFPAVKDGIDWDMFKAKVKEGTTDEPVEQMGLHFDTEVNTGKKMGENLYAVQSTTSRCFMMNIKNVKKRIDKIHPKMFEKLKSDGVKIVAYTKAKLTCTYAHECISNILNAAGVRTS